MRINKSDRGGSGPLKHLRFHWNRSEGHRFRYAWNRVRWHLFPRLHQAGRYPDHVDLELSSSCNMKCPMCYTVTGEFKAKVPHRNMDFRFFCRIVDELAQNGVYSIRLSWRGEPTLNPSFLECIRYAKQKGIREVDSLTNALKLTLPMFEEMVKLQMDWLTISFDGVGETYERIRFPAKFQEMVDKIRSFSQIKKRTGSVKPVLRIQGVWPAIREDPERFFDTFEPIADEISVNALLDYLHKDAEVTYLPDFVCPVPFQRLVIGSDGRAFMCINDELGREPVGDARIQSVREIWNGSPMARIRSIHVRRRGVESLAPCRDCYQPRATTPAPIRVGKRTLVLEQLVGRPQTVGK